MIDLPARINRAIAAIAAFVATTALAAPAFAAGSNMPWASSFFLSFFSFGGGALV